MAQIGLRTQEPGIRLDTRAPQLKLRQVLPKAAIEIEDSRVVLDATQCREEIGLKKPLSFSREMARKGYEACFTYTEQVASEGDILGQPEKYNLETIMASYGKRAFKEFAFNFTRIPRSPVDIEVVPGEVEIDWQLGRVQGDFRPGEVKLAAVGGKVEVYLRQKASLKVDYVPEVDMYG
jgi:hypothetical protein